jgi:hypothetical protein
MTEAGSAGELAHWLRELPLPRSNELDHFDHFDGGTKLAWSPCTR